MTYRASDSCPTRRTQMPLVDPVRESLSRIGTGKSAIVRALWQP
jgi:hypothetical protein